MCNKYINVCTLGDFNLPVLQKCLTEHHTFSAVINTIENTLLSHSLSQIVDFPSRGSNYLDLVFCNQHVVHDDVMCLPHFSTSDHCSIAFNIIASQFSSVSANQPHYS